MSRFEIEDTPIEGVKLVHRQPIGDERGHFERFFCLETMQEAGWPERVVHVNQSLTKDAGSVRGLHYQTAPHAEYKYVSCTQGRLLDVALDLRKDSPTFMQHYSVELTPDNHKNLIVPAGVAHGFQTLEENTRILYLVSTAYAGDHEGGVNPRDPMANIQWPIEITNMSVKDTERAFLTESFEGLTV